MRDELLVNELTDWIADTTKGWFLYASATARDTERVHLDVAIGRVDFRITLGGKIVCTTNSPEVAIAEYNKLLYWE